MQNIKRVAAILVLGLFLVGPQTAEAKKITDGSTVTFEYELTVNESVVDSSEKSGPMEVTIGEGKIIEGLESKLLGMKPGEERQIHLSAEEGYGPINPQAFQRVPKETFPENIQLEVGLMLQMVDDKGRQFPTMVQEIADDSVLLNFNHPLAGQELQFSIKVVSVS